MGTRSYEGPGPYHQSYAVSHGSQLHWEWRVCYWRVVRFQFHGGKMLLLAFFFFFFFFLHMRYKSLVDSKYRKVSYFLPSLCCLLGQPIIWEGVIFIKLRDSKRNILSHIIRYIRGLEVGSSGNIFLCNSLKKTLSILTMYYRY